MICLHGKTVCGGVVSGEVYVLPRKAGENAEPGFPVSPAEEWRRLELAVSAVKDELAVCIQEADTATLKEIFEVHRMMLEDEDILSSLRDAVQNGAAAQQAVAKTEREFSQLLRDTGDEYMIARADDIRDLCQRLTSFLSAGSGCAKPQNPVVLVADELLPGDLIGIGKEKIIGIVMGSGTVFSHVSILIKEMGIPALICEKNDAVKTGMSVLLNADDGTVFFAPDDKTLRDRTPAKQLAAEKKEPSPFCGFSGKRYINIGNPSEMTGSLPEQCDGIGLMRTEYLYLGRADLPGEEEQVSIYRSILEKANGKSVTVRTFDVGSDKSVASLPLKKEENPALGLRGLRVYSLYPEVFRTQLKALLRAAVFGNLRIMYPMVTSRREIDEIRQALSCAAKELEAHGIPYRIPPQGAMIETPAAALLSDEIAGAVDFFSVGTNDLTQYTLALDRQDGRLDRFFDPSHQAILTLIAIAAENAHKNGIEIGICGELASDPALLPQWIALGLDCLSLSPAVWKTL